MLPGFLVVFTIKQLLFFPTKEKHFGNGKKIPLTPGLVYKGKNWIMDKIKHLIQDYINDTKNKAENSRISIWENNVFKHAWDKFDSVEDWKYLPRKWKEGIHYFLAWIVYEIVSQFLRNFVPYLMERYQIEKYIELVDQKLDVEIVKDYYCNYIYKYVMYFVLACGFGVGFWNMIIYLIVK
jgi:hypothetical protein